jgi:hypothetical protein
VDRQDVVVAVVGDPVLVVVPGAVHVVLHGPYVEGVPGRQLDSKTARSPEAVQRSLEQLNARQSLPAASYGATLPTDPRPGALHSVPLDGMTMVSDGAGPEGSWLFEWDGEDSKWNFLGGPPLFAEVVAQEAYGAGVTTYGNLATSGPGITLPFAGDYDVQVACACFHGTANRTAYMSYAIGGTDASDNDSTFLFNGSANNVEAMVHRRRRKTGLGAVALLAKYRGDGSGTPTFLARSLAVWPVRVG